MKGRAKREGDDDDDDVLYVYVPLERTAECTTIHVVVSQSLELD